LSELDEILTQFPIWCVYMVINGLILTL